MGLTQMEEIKQQLYAEAANEDAALAAQTVAKRASAGPTLIARLDVLKRQIAGTAATLGPVPPKPPAPVAVMAPIVRYNSARCVRPARRLDGTGPPLTSWARRR